MKTTVCDVCILDGTLNFAVWSYGKKVKLKTCHNHKTWGHGKSEGAILEAVLAGEEAGVRFQNAAVQKAKTKGAA